MERLSESALTDMCRLMVQSMPVPAAVYYEECMVYVNDAFLRLWKAESPSDVIGRSLTDFVPPEMRDVVRERTRIVREKEVQLLHVENRVNLCDGSPLHVKFCAFPVLVDGTRMVGAFVEHWDE